MEHTPRWTGPRRAPGIRPERCRVRYDATWSLAIDRRLRRRIETALFSGRKRSLSCSRSRPSGSRTGIALDSGTGTRARRARWSTTTTPISAPTSISAILPASPKPGRPLLANPMPANRRPRPTKRPRTLAKSPPAFRSPRLPFRASITARSPSRRPPSPSTEPTHRSRRDRCSPPATSPRSRGARRAPERLPSPSRSTHRLLPSRPSCAFSKPRRSRERRPCARSPQEPPCLLDTKPLPSPPCWRSLS